MVFSLKVDGNFSVQLLSEHVSSTNQNRTCCTLFYVKQLHLLYLQSIHQVSLRLAFSESNTNLMLDAFVTEVCLLELV